MYTRGFHNSVLEWFAHFDVLLHALMPELVKIYNSVGSSVVYMGQIQSILISIYYRIVPGIIHFSVSLMVALKMKLASHTENLITAFTGLGSVISKTQKRHLSADYIRISFGIIQSILVTLKKKTKKKKKKKKKKNA